VHKDFGIFKIYGVTEWSDPSGNLPRYFGPSLGRRAGTAPPWWDGETLVQFKFEIAADHDARVL